MALRIDPKDAARLGVKLPRAKKAPGLRLSDLPGPPGLTRITERMVQREIRRNGFQVLPPGVKIIHAPNERRISDRPKDEQKVYLGALIGDGMDPGALDLQFIWDLTLGAPGNRGQCWMDVKRPIKPKPISTHQLRFVREMRAMGIVAGWAQCWEHAEALLIEAGAPLRMRLPGREVPPWWTALGALPALYADASGIPGAVRLPSGAVLRPAGTR